MSALPAPGPAAGTTPGPGGTAGWDLATFRNSSEQFRAAFDTAQVGMAFLDTHGWFLDANPAFARMLGRTAADIVGTRGEDALHEHAPDLGPDFDNALTRAIDAFERETCYARADGSPLWVRLYASLVRAGGEPLYFALQAVDLPDRSSVPVQRQSPAQHASAPDGGPDTPPLRVLLAEDNAINQRVAQLLLRKLGHVVDTVGNGALALEAVRRVPYDVVLMDVQMPEMDGLEATRRIRAEIHPDRAPRIVAMTASVLVGDRTACASAGMDDYLAKPVRPEQLAAAMNRVAMSRGHRAPPAPPAVPRPAPDHPAEDRPDDPETRSRQRRLQAIRTRVEELFGTDPEGDRVLFAQLADWFIDQTGAALGLLEEAVRQGNATATAEHAHRLKGTAANLGGTELGEMLEQLQIQGARRQLEPSATTIVAGLPRELALFCEALRTVSAEIC